MHKMYVNAYVCNLNHCKTQLNKKLCFCKYLYMYICLYILYMEDNIREEEEEERGKTLMSGRK